MKNLLVLSILLIGVSCKQHSTQVQDELAIVETIVTTAPDLNYEIVNEPEARHPHPYEVKFEMQQLKEDVYDFVVHMKLNDGSYFVSPNAKRDFKGKFTMEFDDNQQLELVSDLLETPRSVEEYDPHPYVRGTVNWVREDTKYRQRVQRTAQDNFHVKGFIQFTIEPQCTLEKVPFIIKYEEGEMRAEVFGC